MEPPKRDSVVPQTSADVAASNKNVEPDSKQDTVGTGEENPENLNLEMPTTENLATSIAELASTAVDKLREVGSQVAESVAESAANVTKKIEEGDLGPYDNPASVEPTDMDPIAEAVHSGLNQKAAATDKDKGKKQS